MDNLLVEGLEDEYVIATSDGDKESIVDMGVFILASFLAGLRGEETLKLVLGETRDYIHESENHRTYKYVVLPLRGRFKGEMVKTFIVLMLLQERIQVFALVLGLEELWI